MKWSRIQDTELAKAAVGKILDNTFDDFTSMDAKVILHYHNLGHVRSMYQHLEDTNEPYDEVLDWAVLFHDVIYDNKPAKELRSGLYFILQAEALGCSLNQDDRHKVVQLILNTEKHENLNCPLVRADLHQLADPVKRFHNFVDIMKESMALYGCDEHTFAENSNTFMSGLAKRLTSNLRNVKTHTRLWQDIRLGVEDTIKLARIVKGE